MRLGLLKWQILVTRMQQVTITIKDRHQEFRQDLNLQISGIIQDILDQMIEDYEWKSTEELYQEAEVS